MGASRRLLKQRASGGAIDVPKPTPRPSIPFDKMGPIENDNYNVLKASPKNWSDAEAKYMATNPAGRLYPDPDAQPKILGKRKAGGKWIAGAIKHPGALHEELHIPEGEKIPAKRLDKAARSGNPKLAARARLAKTLKSFH